jgi:predicted secreted protein
MGSTNFFNIGLLFSIWWLALIIVLQLEHLLLASNQAAFYNFEPATP